MSTEYIREGQLSEFLQHETHRPNSSKMVDSRCLSCTLFAGCDPTFARSYRRDETNPVSVHGKHTRDKDCAIKNLFSG